jgi:TRAP-type transport system periplasmic protein
MKKLACLLSAAAVGLGAAAAAQAQQVLRVSTYVATTHWLVTESLAQWAKELEAATGGKLKANIFATPLGRPQQHFELARDGIADVTMGIPGYTPGRFIIAGVGGAPLAGSYSESLGGAYWRTIESTPELMKEFEGTVPLSAWTTAPMGFFTTKKDVKGIDDFKGLKVHTGGGMMSDVATSLGMVPVIQPPTTAHEVLSNGVVDGIIFTADGIAAFKLDKIVRHAVVVPGGFSSAQIFLAMNPATFKALSPELQAAVRKVSGEHMARDLVGRNWDQRDSRGLDTLKASGGQIVRAGDKLRKDIEASTQGAIDIWLRDVKEKRGIDGRPILARFRGEVAKIEAEIRARK